MIESALFVGGVLLGLFLREVITFVEEKLS